MDSARAFSFRLEVGAVLGAVLMIGAQAQAASASGAAYECEARGSLCVMLPAEPAKLPQKTIVLRDYTASIGASRELLSERELTGDASTAETDFALSTALGDRPYAPSATAGAEPLAIEEAQKILSQLNMLEVFLKSGPAADGDLTVISAKAR